VSADVLNCTDTQILEYCHIPQCCWLIFLPICWLFWEITL